MYSIYFIKYRGSLMLLSSHVASCSIKYSIALISTLLLQICRWKLLTSYSTFHWKWTRLASEHHAKPVCTANCLNVNFPIIEVKDSLMLSKQLFRKCYSCHIYALPNRLRVIGLKYILRCLQLFNGTVLKLSINNSDAFEQTIYNYVVCQILCVQSRWNSFR